MRTRVVGACALLLVAGAASCSGEEPRSFVGVTSGGELAVALVVDDSEEVVAYVCDGESEDHWFRGTAADVDGRQTVDLESDGGATLVATIDGDSVEGTLETAASTHDVALEPTRDAAYGLYRSEDPVDGQAALTGWIVLNDGTQRGVTKIGSTRQPAPQLTALRGRPTISEH